ncbi:hypothetical protein HHK36_003507 [Tetracentron sinense]|uniref:Uncharacterized protein n=1 Tax=Tetracentron sinense TaxID=13715 RepID=A0A834ZNC5_TETSI|nr:hypothetical protein HHK36_003507 [Tetracentron sinense]
MAVGEDERSRGDRTCVKGNRVRQFRFLLYCPDSLRGNLDLCSFVIFTVKSGFERKLNMRKWSEAAKQLQTISLLTQLAAEEALQAEAMAAASVIPVVSSKNGVS